MLQYTGPGACSITIVTRTLAQQINTNKADLTSSISTTLVMWLTWSHNLVTCSPNYSQYYSFADYTLPSTSLIPRPSFQLLLLKKILHFCTSSAGLGTRRAKYWLRMCWNSLLYIPRSFVEMTHSIAAVCECKQYIWVVQVKFKH